MSGGVPARIDGTAKTALLGLIDDAVDAGWTHSRVCAVLGVDRRRAWRWSLRREMGTLDDARPGGRAIHSLLSSERDEIIRLFNEWGDVDRSHRKLAHRGSYLQRVWVSPSTVDRVLAGHGLALAGTPRPARTVKTPWPDWCEWRPNQLWCWDGTQFPACKPAKHVYAIVDVVSRKWIATHLTPAPDSVAARVLFAKALQSEGLLTDEAADRLNDPNDARVPVVLHEARHPGFGQGSADLETFRRAVAEGRVAPEESLLLTAAMSEARSVPGKVAGPKLAKASEGGRRGEARDDAVAATMIAVAIGERRRTKPPGGSAQPIIVARRR